MADSALARSAHLLDPAVVARLGTMELKAKTIVEGLAVGLHRSPYHGFSTEFAEYRKYVSGDDPAWIDWKVYARSDRYYVKKWDADTNLSCHLLLDASASMGYGTGAMTKLEYGAALAAAIAWLVAGQRDAVGLTTFDDHVRFRLPPQVRTGHLHQILIALDKVRPSAGSNVAKPLRELAEGLQRRGLIVLISDLLDDPETVVNGLMLLGARGMEVVVFHVLDEAERTFPFEGPLLFKDLESTDEVLAVPSAVRDHYLAELERHTGAYARALHGAGMDYQIVSTATPLDASLLGYLRARGGR
jgi:uncharacterized protein (DUF58 family)